MPKSLAVLGKVGVGQLPTAIPEVAPVPRVGEAPATASIQAVLEVYINGEWRDLTCYLAGLSLQRGTTAPVPPMSASVFSATLTNSDGILSPWADNSPWALPGERVIRPNMPLRFSITTDAPGAFPVPTIYLQPLDPDVGVAGDILIDGDRVYGAKGGADPYSTVNTTYYSRPGETVNLQPGELWVESETSVYAHRFDTINRDMATYWGQLNGSVLRMWNTIEPSSAIFSADTANPTQVPGSNGQIWHVDLTNVGNTGMTIPVAAGAFLSVYMQYEVYHDWGAGTGMPLEAVATGASFTQHYGDLPTLPDPAYPDGHVVFVPDQNSNVGPNSYFVTQNVGEQWRGQGEIYVGVGDPVWQQDIAAQRWQLFKGSVDSWVDIDDANGSAVVEVQATDAFKYLATYEYDVGETTVEHYAGEVMRLLLIHAGLYSHPIGCDSYEIYYQGGIIVAENDRSRPALELVQQLALVDGGVCYVDRNNAFIYKSPVQLNADPEDIDWVISDGRAPNTICGSRIVTSADDLDIVNVISASRRGGLPVWRQDDESIAQNGRRIQTFSDLPHRDESDTGPIADRLLAERAQLDYHATEVTVMPVAEPQGWSFAAQVELMDLVRLTRIRAVQRLEDRARVLGITHNMTPESYSITLTLGPPTRLFLNRGWDEAEWDNPVDRWSGTA